MHMLSLSLYPPSSESSPCTAPSSRSSRNSPYARAVSPGMSILNQILMRSKTILYFGFLLAKPTNISKVSSFSFSFSKGICVYFQHSFKTSWILDIFIL